MFFPVVYVLDGENIGEYFVCGGIYYDQIGLA